MGYKLTFIEQTYYFLINALICAIILDHPEFFSVLVNFLTIKEIILNIIIDFIYNHNNIFCLKFLTFLYISYYIYNNLIKLLNKYAFNIQLIVLNSIYRYIYCLKLLVEGKQYTSIYTTFTNLNLKNFFIVSAIFMYLLYLLYFSELVIGEQFHHFILKSNIFNNLYDLFNIKFDFVKYYNIISIILMFILFAIILHGTIGLYMFFFDYLKESSFGLWTLLIYIIIIFLFVCMFFNENLYINFLTILPIKI